jgi:oligopeptide transport system ATP-binding protein
MASASGDKVLRVEDLEISFSTQAGEVQAVRGVSFELRQGETLAIVGESGSGKTVTAKSLMRLLPEANTRIKGGEAIFEGQDLLKLSEKRMQEVRGPQIAMVFQDPMTSLDPTMKVGRQITESLKKHLGMSGNRARERAVELLEMVGIPNAEERVRQYPHQFSGGMRQRVVIAIALACEPQILIADEPTTALDVTIQAQILDLIGQLRKDLGMAVIMITHDLGVVAGVADKINVMYSGYIVESAPAEDLFSKPRHPYTLGLLRSIPRIDEPRKEKLIPIEGLPPDLIDAPQGCPFVPRCTYKIDRCVEENPSLEPFELGHSIACWVEVTAGGKS